MDRLNRRDAIIVSLEATSPKHCRIPHRIAKVATMPTLSSMAAMQTVFMTTYGASSDDEVGIMTTPGFQWPNYTYLTDLRSTHQRIAIQRFYWRNALHNGICYLDLIRSLYQDGVNIVFNMMKSILHENEMLRAIQMNSVLCGLIHNSSALV